jgi:hypothetical protein
MAPPFLMAIAVYLAANSLVSAALATWLSIGLWWMTVHVTQWAGDCREATLFGPVAGLYFAGLIRFHRWPGLCGWSAVVAASLLGWSLFPVPWLLFAFPATVAWLIIAHRHGWLWHAWLFLGIALAAAPFVPQWYELSRHWPMIVELGSDVWALAWPAMIGDRTTKSAFAVVQVALILLPCVARVRHSASAVLMVATTAGLVVIGLTQPSAKSFSDAVRQSWIWPTQPDRDFQSDSDERLFTNNTSRILIERFAPDLWPPPEQMQWRKQAPILFGTPAGDETTPWNLCQGRLAGRLISEVADDELRRLAERWNIGSIWACDPATIDRLKKWSLASPARPIAGGVLFSLDRPFRYVLKGNAIWSPQANGDILLTDVIPEQNEVVLSLRYYRNWSAGPGHVVVEPEIDPYDPLPIVRLKLQEPLSRVILRFAR